MTTGHLLIVAGAGLIGLRIIHSAIVSIAMTRLSIARVTAAAMIRLPDDDSADAPTRVGHRVTVHTKQPDDQTVFGVVVGDYVDRISLEDANYVTPDGRNPPLPGRQDFAVDDIAWIDVHAIVTTIGDEG